MLNLSEHLFEVQHHTVPNDGRGTLGDDAGWHHVEVVLDTAHHQSVPRIVATGTPRHNVCSTGKNVHKLALAFITPLGLHPGGLCGCEYARGCERARWWVCPGG